jgi:hypothetical protein
VGGGVERVGVRPKPFSIGRAVPGGRPAVAFGPSPGWARPPNVTRKSEDRTLELAGFKVESDLDTASELWDFDAVVSRLSISMLMCEVTGWARQQITSVTGIYA